MTIAFKDRIKGKEIYTFTPNLDSDSPSPYSFCFSPIPEWYFSKKWWNESLKEQNSKDLDRLLRYLSKHPEVTHIMTPFVEKEGNEVKDQIVAFSKTFEGFFGITPRIVQHPPFVVSVDYTDDKFVPKEHWDAYSKAQEQRRVEIHNQGKSGWALTRCKALFDTTSKPKGRPYRGYYVLDFYQQNFLSETDKVICRLGSLNIFEIDVNTFKDLRRLDFQDLQFVIFDDEEAQRESEKKSAKHKIILEQIKNDGWILEDNWLKNIGLDDFESVTLRLDRKNNPDTTHLVKVWFDGSYVQTAVVAIHNELIAFLGLNPQEVLGRTIFNLINKASKWFGDKEMQEFFFVGQQERMETIEMKGFHTNVSDVELPIDMSKRIGSDYQGFYRISLHSEPLIIGNDINNAYRVITTTGIEKKESETTFNAFKKRLLDSRRVKPTSENIDTKIKISNSANTLLPESAKNPFPFMSPPSEESQSLQLQDNQPKRPPEEAQELSDSQIKQLAYDRLSSKQLFELAKKKKREEVELLDGIKQEELVKERERNKKLVEAILSRQEKITTCLSISAKTLPVELKSDFRPYIKTLSELDEISVEKIINKGNFSILVRLVGCGNERCLQGCSSNPPFPAHPRVELRVYNKKDLYVKLPEGFNLYKYINVAA